MASNPDIFLQGLIGSTGLRPIQELQAGQLGLQQQRLGTQQQQQQLNIGQLAIDQAQRDAADEGAFQEDAARYASAPTPQGMLELATRYPKHYQAVKAAWDVRDEAVRRSHLAGLSDIEAALRNGRPDLAAKRMRDLQAAERNAGLINESNGASQYDDEIAAIERGDKASINSVHAMTLGQIAALTGLDKFGSTYGAVAKQSEPKMGGPGAQLLSPTGEVLASVPYKPQVVRVRPGEHAYEYQPGEGGGSAARRAYGWTPRASNGGDNNDAVVDNKIASIAGDIHVDPDAPLTVEHIPLIASAIANTEGPMRNNNPTNIEDGRFAKSQPGYAGSDGRFAKFDTPANGMAAAQALLRRYYARGQRTVRDIIEGKPTEGGARGPRQIADGGPAPQYRMLTAAEIEQRKLDPATPWQISPQGRVTAVTHGRGSGGGGTGEPRTPDNVYAPILKKIAQGIALTPAEASALTYYRRRRAGVGASSDAVQAAPSGAPQYREGQTATNPTTGAKLVYKGGHWVPAR